MIVRRGERSGTGAFPFAREAARDNRLSLQARGLLAFILSFPDGAEVDPTEMARDLPFPNTAKDVRLALADLERYGYLEDEPRTES